MKLNLILKMISVETILYLEVIKNRNMKGEPFLGFSWESWFAL